MTKRQEAQAGAVDAYSNMTGGPAGSVTPTVASSFMQVLLDKSAMLDEIPEGAGIADYNDATTSVTPIALTTNTWTTITNDGAGAFTNTAYLPEGVTSLMDTATGEFDFSQLSLGDNAFVRNDFTVTPNTNNALLSLRYQLGASGASYTLETIIGRLDSGSGQPYRFSLTPQMIYMGDTNTKDNPVKLQIKLSSNGSVVNAGSSIGIVRR